MRTNELSRWTAVFVTGLMGAAAIAFRAASTEDCGKESHLTQALKSIEVGTEETDPLTPVEQKEFEELLKNQIDPDNGLLSRNGVDFFFLRGDRMEYLLDKELSVAEIEKELRFVKKPPPEQKTLTAGNLAWIKGYRAKARKLWEEAGEEKTGDAALDARLNLAQSYQVEGDNQMAMVVHLNSLENLNDDDLTFIEQLIKMNICEELSDLYLEEDDLKNALKYLEEYNKYQPRSFCGICDSINRRGYENRKKIIEFAMRDGRRLTVKPLAPMKWKPEKIKLFESLE